MGLGSSASHVEHAATEPVLLHSKKFHDGFIVAKSQITAIPWPFECHIAPDSNACFGCLYTCTPQAIQYLLCRRILLRALSPSCQLRNWYGNPHVHGKAPKRNAGRFGSLTASMAFLSPAQVVRSSSILNLITSQSGGAQLPIRGSGPQQSSTIRRRYGDVARCI